MSDEAHARTQIQYAMATYALGVDSSDVDIILESFAPDGVLDARGDARKGHGEIRAFYESALADGIAAKKAGTRRFLRHNLTTSRVVIESADRARGQTYFISMSDYGPDHSGLYTDVFARHGERWLIHHRQIAVEWYGKGSWFETVRLGVKS